LVHFKVKHRNVVVGQIQKIVLQTWNKGLYSVVFLNRETGTFRTDMSWPLEALQHGLLATIQPEKYRFQEVVTKSWSLGYMPTFVDGGLDLIEVD
jgi:hypothetical protein